MDDESAVRTTTEKSDAKFKDGYVQLAEKMEQVKSQMAKMERKYDELYQTVKEKDHGQSAGVTSDQTSAEDSKAQHTSDEASTPRPSVQESSPSTPETKADDSNSGKRGSDMDIEKMEDNPFV